MKFFESIGKAVGDAAGFLGEKNRKAAYLNRIRTVIRCEEAAAEKEYLALGRYYYNNLRDKNNPVTEAHCAELEAIEGRLEKALDQLEQFYQADARDAASIGVIGGEDGPTAMCMSNGEAEEVTLEDVKRFDHDPLEPVPAEQAPAGQASAEQIPAESDENAGLPFEG